MVGVERHWLLQSMKFRARLHHFQGIYIHFALIITFLFMTSLYYFSYSYLFNNRISPAWANADNAKDTLCGITLEPCCNPNRFFEAAQDGYVFGDIDNSFGKMKIGNDSRVENPVDESRSTKFGTPDSNTAATRLPLKRHSKKKLSKNSRKKDLRLLDDEAVNEDDSAGDDDGDNMNDVETVAEMRIRLGLGDAFVRPVKDVNLKYFVPALKQLRSVDFSNFVLSSKIGYVIRLCMDHYITKHQPKVIANFNPDSERNHVPNLEGRVHCDSIPSNESNFVIRLKIFGLMKIQYY